MGLRGPAKRPAYLKVLSGTERPDRPADPSPVSNDQALTELPPPPNWLPNQVARDKWLIIGNDLLKRGLLDEGRLMMFGSFCAMSGKMAQKYEAGDMPAAHLIAQHTSLGKQLGIIGTQVKSEAIDKPAAKGRLASIKERANRTD